MKRANFERRKQQRKQRAALRQHVRSARSASAQIEVLDRRLGNCEGASKERLRLWSEA